MDLKDVRRDYTQSHLSREELADHPIQQFKNWFSVAQQHPSLSDPTAFSLATVDAQHHPHQRIVLLKEVHEDGFVFYTSYASAKGQDILHNPRVAMHFAWLALEQQIRIEGTAVQLTPEANSAYFYSRPRASQLGALASQQSQPIASRAELEARYHQLEEQYRDQPIPMPPHWGGYLIRPDYFEFWQGGRYRLHDRFSYQASAAGWQITRLQP